MAAIKGTKVEREKRLTRIEELDSTGHSQTEIARAVGLTQQSVSRDLKILAQRYIKEQMHTHAAKIARKKDRLRRQRKTLWEAWTKSWEPKEKTSSETVEQESGGKGKRASSRRKAILIKEGRLAAHEYQKLILDNEREESRIDGLYPGPEGMVNVQIIQTVRGVDTEQTIGVTANG